MTTHDGQKGYYGHPIIKPPEWTDLIPIYFWAGGLSGASATLALTQRVRGNDALARTMVFGAAAGTVLSAACLIFDLKKPSRFINMLRVFKPTSPMSVGTYVFSLFGGAAVTAAVCELTGRFVAIGRAGEIVAGLVGPVMSVYTSVLIGDTVVPAWYLGRRSLPAVFAATSAANAGAVGLLFGPAGSSATARRLAIAGAAAVPLTLKRLHTDVGTFQDRAYKEKMAGGFAKAAQALTVAGAACAILGYKSDIVARAGGGLLLAAGLCERLAIMRAGQQSAQDPTFTINAQQPAATH